MRVAPEERRKQTYRPNYYPFDPLTLKDDRMDIIYHGLNFGNVILDPTDSLLKSCKSLWHRIHSALPIAWL